MTDSSFEGVNMDRQIREYVEIDSHRSLGEVIERLLEIRDGLPAECEAEVRMRGDDVFGRHLCVTYLRALTAEEASCEARYAHAGQAEDREAA